MVVSLLLLSCADAYAMASAEIIQREELDALFEEYVKENDLNPDLISVAYLYTPTDETWYHLEDQWYYSASLDKVPLMMLLTEKEHNGELTRKSEINGMPLEVIEEEILINSNNPVAYSTLRYLAQPDECRRMFCRYSDLPEDYYTWDFYGSSYFTARFMTDVMHTLFWEPERFPRMIDCMKKAQPDHYFRLKLGEQYEIAQKYGNYRDENETDWNHTTGIIYTPNPFILTVMTRYGGISETIIGDLATLFCNYTLRADERLADSKKISDVNGIIETDTDRSLQTAMELKEPEANRPQLGQENTPYDFIPDQSTPEESSHEAQTPLQLTEQVISRPVLITTCLAVEVFLVLLLIVLRRWK